MLLCCACFLARTHSANRVYPEAFIPHRGAGIAEWDSFFYSFFADSRAAPETSATIDRLACLSHLCARRIPCPIQTPLQRRMVSLLFYPIQNWMGRASRSKPSRANQTGVRYLDLIMGISTQELRSDAEHGLYRVNLGTTSSSV